MARTSCRGALCSYPYNYVHFYANLTHSQRSYPVSCHTYITPSIHFGNDNGWKYFLAAGILN